MRDWQKATVLSILMTLVILFSVIYITAFEFDNVKSYDAVKREVTITNALGLGSDIAKIKLNTPLVYGVIEGEDRLVAEMTFNNYDSYENVFNDMRFINLNNNKDISREFTYKVKTITGQREIPMYQNVCSNKDNKSICEQVLIDTRYEDIIEWNNLDYTKGLATGEYTIGIFTDVKRGDYVEWIPKYYGKDITEWATWTDSLNASMVAFWNQNEGTGTDLGDSYKGIYNGTLLGGLVWNSTGIIGNGTGTYDRSDDFINFTATQGADLFDFGYHDNFTISAWVYVTGIDTTEQVIVSNTLGDVGYLMGLDDRTGDKVFFEFCTTWETNCLYILSGVVSILNGWTHIVAVYNGSANATQTLIYINGATTSQSIDFNTLSSVPSYTRPLKFGNRVNSGDTNQYWFSGTMDAVGIWNRTLSQAEIASLYDSGAGTEYEFIPPDNPPQVALGTPANYYNSTGSVTFNCSATDDVLLENLSLIIDNVINSTVINGVNTFSSLQVTRSLSEGTHTWNCNATDSLNQESTNTTRTLTIDSTNPVINLQVTADDYHTSGNNVTLNWSINDTNLDSCWYNYGGINTSVTCSDNGTYIPYSVYPTKTITLYANDSVNNENSNSTSIVVKVFQNSLTYDNSTTEGVSNVISLNISYDSTAYPNIQGVLNYNNTNYIGTNDLATNEAVINRTIITPIVGADSNISFFWNISLINDTTNYYNSSTYNQSVLNLNIDDCGSYGFLLLNYSLKDEELKTVINGTAFNSSVQVDLTIYPQGSTTPVINYSNNFTKNNNPKVCLEKDLGDSTYSLYVQTLYDADDYSSEYHNIQNHTLVNASLPQNIDLFDLKDADAQKFLIIFKDENFIPVRDALINIQRKYVSDGIYRSVESPLTDENGNAIGYFDLTGVIYTIVITKYGVTLATFNNIAVYCDDILIGDCRISLNALGSTSNFSDWYQTGGITYVQTFDSDTRTVTTTFNSVDGSSKTVLLNTTKFDRFGNESVCYDTLTTSSGTLTCTIPTSYGNLTAISKLSVNDILVSTQSYIIAENPREIFGDNAGIMLLFMMLILPLMLITSIPLMLFGLIIGLVLGVLMNLYVVNTLVGVGSTLVWLIIAIGIVIYKIIAREDG